MQDNIYTPLQLREIFHIEFLRGCGRKIKSGSYVIKGGTNLRLFFQSFRYSEDMDLDAKSISVANLRDAVISILQSKSFLNTLKTFGIDRIMLPDMRKAKQTETTQRFKIHLITSASEDLFTKVEFSRRGFDGNILVQTVPDTVLRNYKLAPLLVPHYDIQSAIIQKITALAARSLIQARDVFDLYILSPQFNPAEFKKNNINTAKIKKAYENIFEINFEQFRDTVIVYLAIEDQAIYNSASSWDDIKLKVAHFIDEARKDNG